MLVVLLATFAAASTAVSLPAGEAASAWAEPLALAGLSVGGAGAPVVIVVEGARWRVSVRDADGDERIVYVDPPRSAQAREDVAWLLASLAQPVGYRSAAPAPVLPRPVVPPPPAARRASPPPGATPPTTAAAAASSPAPGPSTEASAPAWPPVDAVAATSLAPVAPPEPAAAPAPEPPGASGAPGLSGWVRPLAGVRMRPEVAPVASVAIAGGVAAPGGWRVGAELGLGASGEISELGEGRALGSGDLTLLGGWSGAGRVSPWALAGGGVGARRYTEAGQSVGTILLPSVVGAVGGRVELQPWLALSVGVEGRCDLRATDIVAPDTALRTLPPCGAGLSTGVELLVPGLPRARSSAIQAATSRHQEDT